MEKDFMETCLLKEFGVVPRWATGIKKTKGSIWTDKFISAGYKPTGWRLCDGFMSWWDEYIDEDNKEFIYASQCVRYVEKY